MTKLEKVIKGLECCITDGPDCPNDCPYIGDCNRKQLHTDALVFLKAQEPVAPIERNGFYYCGECRYAFTVHKQKYCTDCGRPVRWG